MLLLSLLLATVPLFLEVDGQSPCSGRLTCSDCIAGSNPLCVWCSDEEYNSTKRCFNRGSAELMCNHTFIEDPQSTVDSDEGDITKENLVSPRHINITLRPGIPLNFNVTVQSARNFPLDLYILADVSASLSDDISTLRTLSSKIIATLHNISPNYRVGLGTFVDKPISPYSPLADFNIPNESHCRNNIHECLPPYSFRHILSLTNNEQEFIEALYSRVNISFGGDVAEAGFDSIVQVVSCVVEIGWRETATQIILYLTDAHAHLAGDGKLAGIVLPNDGKCHLEHNKEQDYYEYTFYNILDYASIGLVEKMLRDTGKSVIIAAASSVQGFFNSLIKQSRRMFLGTLTSNSDNIIDIIETQYKVILGIIGLEPILQIPGITVSIKPIEGCNRTGLDNYCYDVPIEQTVVFDVTVESDRCVSPGSNFEMRVAGFGTVTVTIDSICNCECEEDPIIDSQMCRNETGLKSDSICGLCVCDEESPIDCPRSLINNRVCSGHGNCSSCGNCQCEVISDIEFYYGDTCECDTFSCEVINGRVCGELKECCGGVCQCERKSPLSGLPYTGPTCSCSPDNTTCLNSRNEICSNHGECECGQCQCYNQEYSGELCSNCIRESCQPCNLYHECLLCYFNFSTSGCENCTQVMITTDSEDDDNTDTEICTVLARDCQYTYSIRQNTITGKYIISVDSIPICGEFQFPMGAIIALAIGIPILIIFIGILILLLLKIILMCKEWAELRRFQKELDLSNWDNQDNPLYVSPAIEYTNIQYKRRSMRKEKPT